MKKTIISLFFLLLFINSNATHIVGGTMSYKYLGTLNNGSIIRYYFTIKMFRDCEKSANAALDGEIQIGVYSNNKLSTIDTMFLTTNQTRSISDTCSCCPMIDYCYEEGIYAGMMDLDSGKEYTFITGRCCLAMSVNAEYDQGFALYSYMQNSSNTNSSPYIDRSLINYIWAQKSTQSISFKATDIDNDSLRYELTDPLLGGDKTTPVPRVEPAIDSMFPPFYKYNSFHFNMGYTALYPFGNFAKLSLDPLSGIVVIDSIKYSGSRFYWCLKISAYKNNVLTGITYTPISTHFNPLCFQVGLKEADISNQQKVFPNPFQNQIVISDLQTGISKIEVYDIAGKLLETINAKLQNQTTIYFNQAQQGLYLLRFVDADGKVVGTEKVVKE